MKIVLRLVLRFGASNNIFKVCFAFFDFSLSFSCSLRKIRHFDLVHIFILSGKKNVSSFLISNDSFSIGLQLWLWRHLYHSVCGAAKLLAVKVGGHKKGLPLGPAPTWTSWPAFDSDGVRIILKVWRTATLQLLDLQTLYYL